MFSFIFWGIVAVALVVLSARIRNFNFVEMWSISTLAVISIGILITQGMWFFIFFCGITCGIGWIYYKNITGLLGKVKWEEKCSARDSK